MDNPFQALRRISACPTVSIPVRKFAADLLEEASRNFTEAEWLHHLATLDEQMMAEDKKYLESIYDNN